MFRRDFLKTCGGLLASLVAKPIPLFVPPRDSFVGHDQGGLMSLVSHLGVLPMSRELSICEGVVREIHDWDGIGYPCLVENVCSYPRSTALIYDFDLWNFRHDDDLGLWHRHPEGRRFGSHAAWYAFRRFGQEAIELAEKGGGPLLRWLNKSKGATHAEL